MPYPNRLEKVDEYVTEDGMISIRLYSDGKHGYVYALERNISNQLESINCTRLWKYAADTQLNQGYLNRYVENLVERIHSPELIPEEGSEFFIYTGYQALTLGEIELDQIWESLYIILKDRWVIDVESARTENRMPIPLTKEDENDLRRLYFPPQDQDLYRRGFRFVGYPN